MLLHSSAGDTARLRIKNYFGDQLVRRELLKVPDHLIHAVDVRVLIAHVCGTECLCEWVKLNAGRMRGQFVPPSFLVCSPAVLYLCDRTVNDGLCDLEMVRVGAVLARQRLRRKYEVSLCACVARCQNRKQWYVQ